VIVGSNVVVIRLVLMSEEEPVIVVRLEDASVVTRLDEDKGAQ